MFNFEANSGLVSVGDKCFLAMDLPFLRLPRSLKSISHRCFSWARIHIVTFEVPSALAEMDITSFRKCHCVSIFIPNSVELLSSFLFTHDLKMITFEEDSKCKEIPDYCFAKGRLKSITIPRSVEVIGGSAFFDYDIDMRSREQPATSRLRIVLFELHSALREIKKFCFSEALLATIRIPGSVTRLRKSCFDGCSRLAVVIFEDPSELTFIGKQCFAGCSLRSFHVPAKVKKIGWAAFIECPIDSFTIDSANKTVSYRNGLMVLNESTIIQAIGKDPVVVINSTITCLVDRCFFGLQVRELVFDLPSSLKQIGKSCFADSLLHSICVPRTVEEINECAFSPEVDRFGDRKQGKLEVIEFEADSELRRFGAFCCAHSSIKSICIPRNVETLDYSCFSGCSRLEIVLFESESVLKQMKAACFEGCAVRTICIPESVEEVESLCFGRSKLESIEFESPSELNKIGNRAFFGSDLKEIVIPGGVETIGDDCLLQTPLEHIAFDDPSKLADVGSDCFFSTKISPESLPASVMEVARCPFVRDGTR